MIRLGSKTARGRGWVGEEGVRSTGASPRCFTPGSQNKPRKGTAFWGLGGLLASHLQVAMCMATQQRPYVLCTVYAGCIASTTGNDRPQCRREHVSTEARQLRDPLLALTGTCRVESELAPGARPATGRRRGNLTSQVTRIQSRLDLPAVEGRGAQGGRGGGDRPATAMQRLDETGRRRVGSHCEAKVQDHEAIRLVHGWGCV